MDHLIKANMSIDKTGGKGTRKGRPNYKSSILLKVVRSILPASKLGWEEVAEDYKLYGPTNLSNSSPYVKFMIISVSSENMSYQE